MTSKTSPEDPSEKGKEIRPQPGPQELFLSSPADIIVYGGSAGSGKSFVLLLEPLRHKDVKGFTSTIFRRTYPQITNEGGLWDTSMEIYPHVGGIPRESDVRWKFPSGNSIKFAHLEHEKSKLEYQGSQICYIAFDELTHFSEGQFFYLLSRNRSTCGVQPYVRATCNPDPDSWVAEFISWWIDQETGLAIPERSGVVRYFVRHLDNIYWADSKDELWDKVHDMIPEDDFHPQSFTFIAAKLDDNPALTKVDPGYRGRLMALPLVERERLLGGNWKIRHTAGTMFRTGWFKFIDRSEIPVLSLNEYEPDIYYLSNEHRKVRGKMRKVRVWDTAATEPSPENKDPDWTAGVLMGELEGRFYIIDLVHVQKSPGDVEDTMEATADLDGKTVEIGMEIEPGSAGKREAERFKRTIFSGYTFHPEHSSGDKVTRAKPFSSAVQHGLVYIVRAPWNNEYLSDLINFPNPKYHDDCVDASSAAHNYLTRKGPKKTKGLSSLVRTR
jgi:predicted phage terminase large subunit-like protein